MQSHAVGNRAHAVFPYPEMHISTLGRIRLETSGVLDQGVVRRRQVGGSSDQMGNTGSNRVEHGTACLAGGHLVAYFKLGEDRLTQIHGTELIIPGLPQLLILLGPGGKQLLPGFVALSPPVLFGPEIAAGLFGDMECFIIGHTERFLGCPNLLFPQGRPVGIVGSGLIRRALGDR